VLKKKFLKEEERQKELTEHERQAIGDKLMSYSYGGKYLQT